MKNNSGYLTGISSFSPFSVLIVFLLFCLVGLSLMPMLSVQLVPSRSYASLNVSCFMPNASPQVTETELSSPIEAVLNRLNGVQKISSRSGSGYANIDIELDKWVDPEMFRFEAATMLKQLYPKLPKGSSYPQVYLNKPDNDRQFGSSVVGYTLNGPGNANDIAAIAEKIVRPAMAKLKGIYKLDISGSAPAYLSISEDNEKMRMIGLNHNSLANILSTGLASQDLGLIKTRIGHHNLSINHSISDLQSLSGYPVFTKNGRIFRLSDVADIKMENVQPSSYYRINGENLINISVYAEEHVNTIKLVGDIKNEIAIAEKKLPAGYRMALSYDNTEYIKDELNKIYFRTFLSIAILLVFVLLITRQLRYMLIIITSLLVNVLLSFIFYYLFKLEIHLYSLAGITISIGLVIDNVIIIVEDIRHTGRKRVFAAILASTLTALGALSVIFFLNETQKINLLDFAIAIIISLVVSLPVAYFFIPAMLDRFPVTVKKTKILVKRRRKLVWFGKLYHRQLTFMLRFRWGFVLLFVLVFGLPVYLLPEKTENDTFFAKTYNSIFANDFYSQTLREPLNKYLGGVLFLFINNKGQAVFENADDTEQRVHLNVNITMPNGATLGQMNEVTKEFEQYLNEFNEQLEVFTANISSPNNALIDISFKKEYEVGFPYRLKHLLESKAIYSGAADFNVYGVGRGFSNAINLDQYDSTIEIKGYNYNELQSIALQISDTLSLNPRVRNVLITTASRWDQKPYEEYMVNITKPDYLTLYKIGRNNMSGVLQNYQEKDAAIGYLPMANDSYLPVSLASNKHNIPGIWESENLPIQVNDTTLLRLNNLSNTKKVRVGESIVKQNQTYLLYVHYQFIGSGELNAMVKERVIKTISPTLPYGYSISSAGRGWWTADGNGYLWFIPLILLIIYMISAILLESLVLPISVILMIPFSFIGVFLIFYLLGLQFDQGGYASLLMLAGLVTNAALYIINDINHITGDHKYDKKQQIKVYIKAFNAKAMPIMITTASAIISLLPFLINGEEKGFWVTLSAGTIGGLLFSVLGVYIFLPLCLLRKLSVR